MSKFNTEPKIDVVGILRGGCKVCGEDECPVYQPPQSESCFDCAYCGCKPVKHVNMTNIEDFISRVNEKGELDEVIISSELEDEVIKSEEEKEEIIISDDDMPLATAHPTVRISATVENLDGQRKRKRDLEKLARKKRKVMRESCVLCHCATYPDCTFQTPCDDSNSDSEGEFQSCDNCVDGASGCHKDDY